MSAPWEFHWYIQLLLFAVCFGALAALIGFQRKCRRLREELNCQKLALETALERISAQASQYAGIHQAALCDLLTGLPQRAVLLKRIQQEIVYTRSTHQFGAILMLDVDAFRKVNQAYGLSTGDAILQAIGERLTEQTRAHDLISRTNGDEFTVLLTQMGDNSAAAAQNVHRRARTLHAAITGEPFRVASHVLSVHISIGITMLQPHGPEVDQILQEAGMALAKVQENGGNQFLFFNPDLQNQIEQELALERDLRAAVCQGQLALYAQSKYDRSGAIIGAELLSRWQHPTLGAIAPARFIPVLESTDLMLPHTYWVLEQACQLWGALTAVPDNFSLSLNISPQCLLAENFVTSVMEILERHTMPCERLVFEITEAAWLDDLNSAVRCMSRLTAAGIRFSVDDFGTGYTNLTYLKALPIYELKIDRSQIQGLPDDTDSRAIVRMILSLAQQLGLYVVAEGIETQEQADFLFQHNCNAIQGYLKARPQPLEEWLGECQACTT